MKQYRDYSKFNQKYSWATVFSDRRLRYPWYLAWANAKQRCLDKHCPSYKSYGEKGIKFFITVEEVKILWFRDKAYNMKIPSIDRIDTYGNYIFSNCQFIELKENCSKPRRKRQLLSSSKHSFGL